MTSWVWGPPKPAMIHLRTLDLQLSPLDSGFPFSLPIIQSWEPLTFTVPVTFFVGENGSGKSTLLEALAAAAGSITAGAEGVKTDPTLKEVRLLSNRLRVAWNKRTRRGFFLRSEDFIGYVKRQAQTRAEMEAEVQRVDIDYEGRSEMAKGLARMPFVRELHDMKERYGEGLEVRSHGEQYLDFFQNRFVPGGLYLLDEPEAPLSPMRQLGFISLLKEMVNEEAQFIIATHSPILMAFPDAVIWDFNEHPIKQMPYESLEHVSLTRDFLNNPESFLRHL